MKKIINLCLLALNGVLKDKYSTALTKSLNADRDGMITLDLNIWKVNLQQKEERGLISLIRTADGTIEKRLDDFRDV